jgi:deoxyhypusine synthase
MNVAAKALPGEQADVRRQRRRQRDRLPSSSTPSAAGGKSAIWILGGGSPKNFALQTEPQIQEVMGIDERGHDYFLQITDARPDTGGLSGATPAEAVSWGKIDPDRLPDAVVCYVDSTIALPILAAYALDKHAPRTPKRLFDRRDEMMQRIRDEYQKSSRNESAQETARGHAVHQGGMLERDR